MSKFVCDESGEKGLTAGMKSEKEAREKMKGQKKERRR